MLKTLSFAIIGDWKKICRFVKLTGLLYTMFLKKKSKQYLVKACLSQLLLSIAIVLQSQDYKLFETVPPKKSRVFFKNTITESQNYNALTHENMYNGGGVAVGDINNDGLDDIYFVSNMKYNKLYLNLGDMKFKDITQSAGVSGREGWKTGVTMVDINADGLLDIYVCYCDKSSVENRRNQLFINMGNLKFEEKAKEYGLDCPTYSTLGAFSIMIAMVIWICFLWQQMYRSSGALNLTRRG